MEAPITAPSKTANSGSKRRTTMKYMLMMHTPRGTGEWEIFSWAPEDFQAHVEHQNRLNQEITEAGEWVEEQAPSPPAEAKRGRSGANDEPVTDGPCPEAKQFLAGYWIVDVEPPDRAYEIAAEDSAAPGPGGAPLNMAIEVRQVMGGAPAEA